jgi:hypothetical protein
MITQYPGLSYAVDREEIGRRYIGGPVDHDRFAVPGGNKKGHPCWMAFQNYKC